MSNLCKGKYIDAFVQENGIIRIEPSGRFLGRLDGIAFDELPEGFKKETMKKEQINGCLARGYCHPENVSKVVDPTLMNAMAEELLQLIESNASELETECMRLAACGVSAGQNTESSTKDRITPDSPYYSASYQSICAAIDREIALRAEVERLTEWRPIETAPKDGTEILLCSAVIHDVGVCYWDDEKLQNWTWGCGRLFLNPQYWMPLPKKPDNLTAE